MSAANATDKDNCLTGVVIHLAEDEFINQRMMTAFLEEMGACVIVSENGRQLLENLEKKSGHLIIMDIRMPVMDGIEATTIIREREKIFGGRIPVIALTAQETTDHQQLCLEAGMDAYLTKPVILEDLTSEITRLCQSMPFEPSRTD
ncbi:MAG: response regulator [Thermodesulfobacteriota bacterium]